MNNAMLVEEVDFAIENMVMQEGEPLTAMDPVVLEVVQLAAELRALPRPEFRESLKAELLSQPAVAYRNARMPTPKRAIGAPVEPRLFQSGSASFSVRGRSFGISVAMHAVMVGLIVLSGMFVADRAGKVQRVTFLVAPDVTLPPASLPLSGGGGGGSRSKVEASHGAPPKSSLQSMTPPIVVRQDSDPKLQVEESVVVPPDIHFKPSPNIGDPLSAALNASNGVGAGSGIGSGEAGGIGVGTGKGLGLGYGAGAGGGFFRLGGGVSAPRFLSGPEPQYSEEARKAKFQGTVVLAAIISPDGVPREVHVARSLGMGLDQKAVEAVKQWRFEPGKKDGKPVSVLVNIEVNFRLY